MSKGFKRVTLSTAEEPENLAVVPLLPPERIMPLLEAAKDFVRKVETGRARSKDSYAKFKAAIQIAEGKR